MNIIDEKRLKPSYLCHSYFEKAQNKVVYDFKFNDLKIYECQSCEAQNMNESEQNLS